MLGELSEKPMACLEAAQSPDRVEFSPRVFWKSRALSNPCSLGFPRKQSQQRIMGLEASHLISTGLSSSSEEGLYLK